MIRGSTPTTVAPIILARALSPYSATALSDAIKRAAAPSLMPDAFPAVTVPSAFTTGLSLFSPSKVVEARGCSSVSITSASPLRCGIITGMISLTKKPLLCAAAVRCWLLNANLS